MGIESISAPGTGDLLTQVGQIQALGGGGTASGATGTGGPAGPAGEQTEAEKNAPYGAVAGQIGKQLSQSAGNASDGAKTALAGIGQSNLQGAQSSAASGAVLATNITSGIGKKEAPPSNPPSGPAAATGSAIPGSTTQ